MTAMINSYLIASIVTVATMAITFPAAYVFGARTQTSNGRIIQLVEGFSNIPLAFPTITVGIALLPVYSKLGLLSTFTGTVLAHMIMAVPYALRALVSSVPMVPTRVRGGRQRISVPAGLHPAQDLPPARLARHHGRRHLRFQLVLE